MRFITFSALVLAVIASAFPTSDTSENLSVLDKRDTYSCAGSALCGSTLGLKKACDDAVNSRIIRNDVVNYGAAGSGKPYTGTCQATAYGAGSGYNFGCGIFIEGPASCVMTGNAIWWGYQDIRNAGCGICGKKMNNNCVLKIDYVSGGCQYFGGGA